MYPPVGSSGGPSKLNVEADVGIFLSRKSQTVSFITADPEHIKQSSARLS
jgi:hypothetical protein